MLEDFFNQIVSSQLQNLYYISHLRSKYSEAMAPKPTQRSKSK